MGFFDFFKKKKTEEVKEESLTPTNLPEEEPAEDITSGSKDREFGETISEPAKETQPDVLESQAETQPAIEFEAQSVPTDSEDILRQSDLSAPSDWQEVAEETLREEAPEFLLSQAQPEKAVPTDEVPQAETLPEAAETEPEVTQKTEADFGYVPTGTEPDHSPEVAAEDQAEEKETTPEAEPEVPVKKGFFHKLVEGLTKTRNHVMQGVNNVLSSFTSIDEDFYEELEEALIIGDLGVNTAIKIVAGLKEKVKERRIKDPQEVKALLKEELKEQMQTAADAYDFIHKKTVLLVIGVNGVGKTTTIGKLASQYKKEGKKVMLAAADTFRAAAIDQLKEWANRSEVPIVAQAENSDPGAVIYDAIASAKSKDIDILICDTAGRLHNKKNLMNELGKIYRIIGREYPEAHLEVFLVLDSTTGQNALAQAKEFKEMADITGIVLTKLDGTSKGGIAIAISADLKLPVKYIGVGEGIDDLRPFDADSFIEALFEE